MIVRQMNVIKRGSIQEQGSYTIPAGQARPAQQGTKGSAPSPSSVPAQVRMIEGNSDYVILEIQCGCGQKSFVQCNYGNVAASR